MKDVCGDCTELDKYGERENSSYKKKWCYDRRCWSKKLSPACHKFNHKDPDKRPAPKTKYVVRQDSKRSVYCYLIRGVGNRRFYTWTSNKKNAETFAKSEAQSYVSKLHYNNPVVEEIQC